MGAASSYDRPPAISPSPIVHSPLSPFPPPPPRLVCVRLDVCFCFPLISREEFLLVFHHPCCHFPPLFGLGSFIIPPVAFASLFVPQEGTWIWFRLCNVSFSQYHSLLDLAYASELLKSGGVGWRNPRVGSCQCGPAQSADFRVVDQSAKYVPSVVSLSCDPSTNAVDSGGGEVLPARARSRDNVKCDVVLVFHPSGIETAAASEQISTEC